MSAEISQTPLPDYAAGRCSAIVQRPPVAPTLSRALVLSARGRTGPLGPVPKGQKLLAGRKRAGCLEATAAAWNASFNRRSNATRNAAWRAAPRQRGILIPHPHGRNGFRQGWVRERTSATLRLRRLAPAVGRPYHAAHVNARRRHRRRVQRRQELAAQRAGAGADQHRGPAGRGRAASHASWAPGRPLCGMAASCYNAA
jgi:hypothetical protein